MRGRCRFARHLCTLDLRVGRHEAVRRIGIVSARLSGGVRQIGALFGHDQDLRPPL